MKKTTLTAIALALCVSTQLFAQKTKEDTITFSLKVQAQKSVSTSSSSDNAGTWNGNPFYYKTFSSKMTEKDLIKAVSQVLYGTPSGFTSKATLVLVQGELSGFFNLTEDMEASEPYNTDPLDGTFDSFTGDLATDIPNSTDSLFAALPNGRHFQTNPVSGRFPIGHFQPWGQIYVKDLGNTDSSRQCVNVTYFFALSVQECYDCFYLNSFISDAKFSLKTTTGQQEGPPCCSVPVSSRVYGSGKDRYYMTLSFDNTINNPYLWSGSDFYVGVDGLETDFVGEGIVPDVIPYNETIRSGLANPSPYLARFTLNGIVTYNWKLTDINSSDIYPDFVGNATYDVNGYGYIALFCSLMDGSVKFTEKLVKTESCCTGEPWYDSWYGVGAASDEDSFSQETPFNIYASLTYHVNWNWNYIHDEFGNKPYAVSWPSWLDESE